VGQLNCIEIGKKMLKTTMIMGVLVLAGVAFGVYNIEARVEGMRSELRNINAQIVRDKEATHVLEAEWSYLNQPQRLAELSDQILQYKDIQPSNILRIADVPMNSTVTASSEDNVITAAGTNIAQR
jgi:hypothetical protein